VFAIFILYSLNRLPRFDVIFSSGYLKGMLLSMFIPVFNFTNFSHNFRSFIIISALTASCLFLNTHTDLISTLLSAPLIHVHVSNNTVRNC
jgi:hypothetical protein